MTALTITQLVSPFVLLASLLSAVLVRQLVSPFVLLASAPQSLLSAVLVRQLVSPFILLASLLSAVLVRQLVAPFVLLTAERALSVALHYVIVSILLLLLLYKVLQHRICHRDSCTDTEIMKEGRKKDLSTHKACGYPKKNNEKGSYEAPSPEITEP